MKIEVGKFYRTRCGEKVVVYAIFPEQEFGVHGARLFLDRWIIGAWKTNGFFDSDGTSPTDIVSEWTDEPPAPWKRVDEARDQLPFKEPVLLYNQNNGAIIVASYGLRAISFEATHWAPIPPTK